MDITTHPLHWSQWVPFNPILAPISATDKEPQWVLIPLDSLTGQNSDQMSQVFCDVDKNPLPP